MKRRMYLFASSVILYPVLILIGLFVLCYLMAIPIIALVNPSVFDSKEKFDKGDCV